MCSPSTSTRGLRWPRSNSCPPGRPSAPLNAELAAGPVRSLEAPRPPGGRCPLRNRNAALAALTLAVLAHGGRAWPQGGASEADWPMYNHDPAGWRFNPAEKTLGPANVGRLVEKWRFPAADSKETDRRRPRHAAVVAGRSLLRHGHVPGLLQARRRRQAPLGLPQSRPARPCCRRRTVPRHREAAGRGLGGGHLRLGAGRRTAPSTSRTRAAGCTASTPETGQERWKVDSRAPTFPGAHWNNLPSPRRSWPTARSSSAAARWSSSSPAPRRTPAAPAAASSWRSSRRPARSSGSTTSARSRRSSIRRSSSKDPGASTSSSTAPRRAASGPRRRTTPNPTRCSSAPT